MDFFPNGKNLLSGLRTISRLQRFPQLLGATQQVLCIFIACFGGIFFCEQNESLTGVQKNAT